MGLEKRPKISRTSSLRKKSEQRFEEIFNLDCGFEAMRVAQESDYGIDYIVRLVDANGTVLSESFLCQLKSRKKAIDKDDSVRLHGFPVKTINLLRSEPLPSYVFLYDHASGKMYWQGVKSICEYLGKNKRGWKQQNTVTLYFPKGSVLDNRQIKAIYDETQSICKQLTEARPTLDMVAGLKKYADLSVTFGEKEQHILVKGMKKGLAGSFKLKKGDYVKFREAVLQRRPFSGPVQNGMVELTFNGAKVYELTSIERVHLQPHNASEPLTLRIPQTDLRTGPFVLRIKLSGTVVSGETTKEDLPWFFKMTLNLEHKEKSQFAFKFFRPFASTLQYLDYLKFMKCLRKQRKLEVLCGGDESKKVPVIVTNTPEIKDWEVEFFENLALIENHTSLRFTVPEKVTKDEYEQAFIYARLLSEGRAELPTSNIKFEMLGKDLKIQAQKLLSARGTLTANLQHGGLLCGEDVVYDFQCVLENATLVEDSVCLLRNLEKLEDETAYSLEYVSKDRTQIRLTQKPRT